MPSILSSLRRALGLRSPDGSDRDRPDGVGDRPPVFVVPVTLRRETEDHAEIRLVLAARVSSATLSEDEVRRVMLAHVVPAAGDWVERRRLAALADTLGPRLREVEESICHRTRTLGADLLALDVVAVEHLLVSPSEHTDEGEDHGIS